MVETKRDLRVNSIMLFREKLISKERHHDNLNKIESGEINVYNELSIN